MSGGSDDPAKEGLLSAIDVTKYTLAVAGAGIAFLISSDTLKNVTSNWGRLTITFALASFGISAVGGLLVLLQGASAISNAEYSLEHPLLKYPGMVNILGLAAGFLCATGFIIGFIWTGDP
jgi:hypothetical protein